MSLTEHRTVEMYLREPSIDAGPNDGSFLTSLRRSLTNVRGVHPPVAFVEVYCDDSRSLTKIRRLYLIVIDSDRSRNVGKQLYWQFQRAHLSARYSTRNASTPCQFPRMNRTVRTGANMCMDVALMGRTGRAICCGPAEGLMAIFGELIRCQAATLTCQRLTL